MAIKSLNQRLDELSSQGDSQLKPIVEMPTDGAGINLDNVERLDYEIQEPYETNDVQVASLPGKFVTGVSRMFSKETKELASQAAQEVAPKPITPSPDKAVVIPKFKDVPQPKSIEDLQTALVQAKTAGTPPDVLVNLDRIEGEEDFKRMVDALNITSGVKVEKMSFEDLQKMAVERGYGNGFLSELTDIKEIYADIAPDIMRLRFASYNNAEITVKLFEQANKNPADMETKAKLLYHINLHTALTETYTSVRSGAARATAAGNIIIPSSTSDEMAKLLSNPEVDANLKKLAEKMGMLLEQSQKEGLINKVSKVGLAMDLWDRTWKNGLLSGLGTHVVNLTSNTTFLFGSIATRQLAGFVGAGKRALGREAEVEFGEAASMIAGLVHSWRDAFRLGYVALKTGTTKEMREGIDIGTDALFRNQNGFGEYGQKIVTPEEFEELVGKDAASTIMQKTDELNRGKVSKDQYKFYDSKPADLTIGGEGMKKFYDQILPKFLDKYAKKWDGKVGKTNIQADRDSVAVQYIDVTPKMKESVLTKGQPLFAIGAGGAAVQQEDNQ